MPCQQRQSDYTHCDVLINEYFADHPEMVLGRHALTGSMYRANEYTVEPMEGDIEAHFVSSNRRLADEIDALK